MTGELVLITNAGEQLLTAGMAAGFLAGEANGHHLVNRSDRVAVYLEAIALLMIRRFTQMMI
jgi:uncharacterized cupin superfamily protein